MSGGSGTPRGLSSELMGRALLLGDPRGSSLRMPGTAPRTEPAGADTRPWLRFVPELLRWPRVGWDLFRGQSLWWPGCGQQWNGTVPSPEGDTFPFPHPAPRLSSHPQATLGMQKQRVAVSPVPFQPVPAPCPLTALSRGL